MSVPKRPKIYHITHVDRLTSIVARGGLWCSDKVTRQNLPGTNIGMDKIKNVRIPVVDIFKATRVCV